MKKITLLILFFACIGATVNAQSYKFGHINSQEVISLMTEMDSARVHLEAYRVEMADEMQGMQDEYYAKYNVYQQKQATWTPALKESKERELQEIVQSLQQFEKSVQQEMQNVQQNLMAPVYKKAQEAINKVAKENNMTYVYDLSSGALIYWDETVSMNLLELVKKELGIPAEKVAPTQLPQDTAAAK